MIRLKLPGPAAPVIACRAVLFDMDGTLVDSRACVERTWRAWGARHGLDAEEILRLSPGRQQQATIALAAPHLDPGTEADWLRRAEENCREGIIAVPGAARLLAALPPAKWAVVTSAWRRLAEIRLGAARLPTPAVLVTADEMTASKPAPDGYLMAAARLGVGPGDCLVLEDTPVGVAAGQAAGMRVVAVTTTFRRDQLPADHHIADYAGVRVAGGCASRRHADLSLPGLSPAAGLHDHDPAGDYYGVWSAYGGCRVTGEVNVRIHPAGRGARGRPGRSAGAQTP